MAKLVLVFAAVIIGCLSVEGFRIFPERVTPTSLPRVTPNDPRCKQNGLFANPTDCTKYYVCINGQSQDRQCPGGMKFDSFKHCTFDEDADCGIKDPEIADIVCPESYGIFPFPKDCHKYIFCSEAKPKIKVCPDNYFYSNNVGCVDADVCPQTQEDLEKPSSARCEQNGLFANPADCTKYYKCFNGQSQDRQCPEGMKFDSFKHCTFDEDADCGIKDPEIADIVCPESYGIFPFVKDCHKYIVCIDAKPKIKLCPDNYFYSNNVGCVEADVCPQTQEDLEKPSSDRCKQNGLFVNPTDCTKYYKCFNGQSQDRQCPEGFKFDSFKYCTPDEDADCGIKDPEIADIVCPESYGQFPYPKDCHKYIFCSEGKPKIKVCPDNQFYSNIVGCVDADVCPQSADSIL